MHSCRPGDSPSGRSLMGARHERSVPAGPSARQAPEKRAVHAFTPLERTPGVDADMADLLSIATWTRGRRVNDESGTGRGERTHGFLSGHAMVRNPWNDGRLRTAGIHYHERGVGTAADSSRSHGYTGCRVDPAS